MKSMPASSAICARRLQSGQLPDQRSGTMVTARPDEQLAPNRPICSLLSEYMARRDCREAACTGVTFSFSPPPTLVSTRVGEGQGWGSGGFIKVSTLSRHLLLPHPNPPHEGEGKVSRLVERRAHPRHHLGRRVGERRDRGLDLLAAERIDLEADLGDVRDKTFVLHGGIEG